MLYPRGLIKITLIKKLFFVLLLFRISFGFACDLPDHFDFDVSNDEEILYSGCYDAINKGPHIIQYTLTRERVESESVKRPSARFTRNRDGGVLQNLLEENGYSLPVHDDYTHSGYDRGHMAPNGDFNDTRENALLTFFIANIWPQTPAVNRSEWLKTENETRRLAVTCIVVKVVIIVDEFSDKKVKDIQVPLNFKRRVYDADSDELVYAIDVYQE
ncbi:MAG: DNA/RNA non-specific endonuclease [Treponema sp.]|jgi:endonuclease G|nr:DNA/RNA non-specific endonuclease [Treponema sp.]